MPNLFPLGMQSGEVDRGLERAEKIRFGRSVRFDFVTGEFIITPSGKMSECSGADAWLAWCQKALKTARYRYLVYSRNYGQEFDELLTRGLPREANELEIIRITTETLQVDPRTAEIRNFSFFWEGDSCLFRCEVSNVLGQKASLEERMVTV